METGILSKMILVGFLDQQFKQPSGDVYVVLINPETYSLTYGNKVNTKSAQGASEEVTTFNKRSPQTLNFKFLFDGTGVIRQTGGINVTPGILGGAPPVDVALDLAYFKKVVYGYESSTHQPPYVQLRWGNLCYNCQLIRMTVNFKLFKPDGTPLRAEADCSFNGVVDDTKLALFQDPESPDLTHVRTVAAGDTLPLLCYREYGDSKYYYQIAKYNKLTDFKQLTPGMKLLFPPAV
jgi:nucleoid-associated protein YgaU